MKKIFFYFLLFVFFLSPIKTTTLAQNEFAPEEEQVPEEVEAEAEEVEAEAEEVEAGAEEQVPEEIATEEQVSEEAFEEIEAGEEGEEPTDPTLIIDRIFDLLTTTIGRLTTKPLVKTLEGLKKMKAKVIEEFKKGFITIPKIGLLKFEKVVEKVKEAQPKMVAMLYDLTGKTVQTLQAGAFVLKILRLFITGSLPSIECEVIFFKNKGKLTQTTSSEGEVTFILEFEKPFMIPTGVNRQAPIQRFEVKMSADQRYAQTKTRLFGTQTEEPSLIRLDLSYPPFTFVVQSKNIPMATLEPLLKATPLANVILKTLTLRIMPYPPSINITAVADMSKAQMGITGPVSDAQVTAGLGMMGLYFVLNIKNVTLPYNVGVIHEGKIQVGTPM